ncbi:hypothetical protein [Rhizobium sp. Root482]|uniref:hypothetical protein n=1 Tax=Rhizobium sp. Root482 TaxID=1736543 RepID=UPI0006FDACC8|nr:hypothetical protein [Rhizobium sp. Root482]KQY12618.1 hypothetical protein ASD31_15420 [Rhizobium sp. Root482]
MKSVLIIAAAMGLSAPAAFADCEYHSKVNAAVDVDKTITTASIAADAQSTEGADVLLKGDRMPAETAAE